MTISLHSDPVPLRVDERGVIYIGDSRVSLDIVIDYWRTGMRPEEIPIALAPFGQVDSSLARKYEGTGLGLPLTKAFVDLHGGTMDIASEVGIGTTVTVTFPIAAAAAQRAA